MLITDEYRKLNAQVHEKSGIWGILATETIHFIKRVCEKIPIESILDYGCGKGRLGKVLSCVQSYDPAMPEFSAAPKPADLVVCTAVLEHIEPECLDEVLDELKFLAWKVVILVIDTGPSRYVLADGRNAHLIQQPFEWWLPKLTERWKIKGIDVGDGVFTFVGTTLKG